MNRKGQTLIIFVIMIPIILLLAALVVDVGLVTNAKIKLSGTTTPVLKEFYEKRKESNLKDDIKKLYEKNEISVRNLEVIVEESSLEIANNYEIESMFGKLIGIKNYKVSIHKKIIKIEEEYRIIKE